VKIPGYYSSEKKRYLENCTRCGLCAKGCPILPFTDVRGTAFPDIQQGVFDYMANGMPNQHAFTKAFACMECFKCTQKMCPEGLNPLLINELIKGDYITRGFADPAYEHAGLADSSHRVLASIQVGGSDYERITAASERKDARYVFFPGCNVYYQPEKILNAMDIIDRIGDAYAFLPGLNYCCGDSFLFQGDVAGAQQCVDKLMIAIADIQPEALIVWCPTCQCRFEKSIRPALDVPFKILSFPQYLAANMQKLTLTQAAAGTVTLHEACKAAYTGLDLNGPREVLKQLPGVTLKEMQHHGKDTLCCGSGAVCWFPQSFDQFRDRRLEEAAASGAGRLVTVCHFCSQTFVAEERRFNLRTTNYLNLVAAALGIRRDEKFQRYMLWRDMDRILGDAHDQIAESPFGKERIVEVLRSVFIDV
jgi:Fe-S oxidoreductase